MTLYHGSWLAVERPELSFSRANVDFGRGFYTTPYKEQAEKWSERFQREKGAAVVSAYAFDETSLPAFRVLAFDTYCGEWLDFIAVCRRGEDDSDYDLVIGGVANDRVFNTLTLYFRSFIDQAEALRRLRYEQLNSQYCFRNQALLDRHLKFIGSEAK